MALSFGGTVAFPVAREVAFAYLADPAHRAQWQSSLARVEDVDGPVGDDQSWTDVTKPGLRPAMRTTAYRPPAFWSESGTWRFVRADLGLTFLERGVDACDVRFSFRIHALGPVGLVATLGSVLPVRADLRRAARILGSA